MYDVIFVAKVNSICYIEKYQFQILFSQLIMHMVKEEQQISVHPFSCDIEVLPIYEEALILDNIFVYQSFQIGCLFLYNHHLVLAPILFVNHFDCMLLTGHFVFAVAYYWISTNPYKLLHIVSFIDILEFEEEAHFRDASGNGWEAFYTWCVGIYFNRLQKYTFDFLIHIYNCDIYYYNYLIN